MTIDYDKIALPNFFKEHKYNRLNIYQKENIIIGLFHCKNWDQIKPKYRIYILQEFENIQAKKQKRKPYKIIVLSEYYKYDLLMDLGVRHIDKKIFIRKSFLEKGIKQGVEEKKAIKMHIDFLNLELLDGLLHEQYHIIAFDAIDKMGDLKSMSNLEQEHLEYLIWLMSGNIENYHNEQNNNIKNGKKYLYRMIPDEYYAFKYAEHNVCEYFSKLTKIYGKEKNMNLYLKILTDNKQIIEEEFRENESQNLPYDEIYKFYLQKYINDYCQIENQNHNQTINMLNNAKRLIKKI